MGGTLAPLPRDRIGRLLRGRTVVLRRLLTAILLALAAFLACAPPAESVNVLVASRDLAPGAVLNADDVRAHAFATDSVPDGALAAATPVAGRLLVGAARRGEPLTDLRLAGPALTGLVTGDAQAAAVAVRPADPGVADLLRAGSRVDVITQDSAVLAEDAAVLAVRSENEGRSVAHRADRLVVLALTREDATKVAAAALTRPVAITLRK
ncbi:SAF domain-containing protein [Allokutzneria albata]|uniref:Flp pilus assembly protein CpaB n=1 Tax=Allokutzneria albata TaxID=211114 RepID=A0A1H0B4D1_ALLAB|nr:SAF domain-containing protein [Allokutzneria albata]SDN40486.1 Flp pilus assembly protein CpaB [Allokutzneria albata]